jgi:hypothetical protein
LHTFGKFFFISITLQTIQWMAVCIFSNHNSRECHINHVGTQVTGNMMEQSLMAWYLWKFGLWFSVYACNTHYPWFPVTYIFRRWSEFRDTRNYWRVSKLTNWKNNFKMCLGLWETQLKLAQSEILHLVLLIFNLCH